MNKEILPSVLGLLLAILVLTLAIQYCAVTLTFSNASLPVVTQLFGVLFTVALFLERSLEVFVNVWREADATQLELKVKDAQDSIDRAAAANQAIAANQQQLTSAMADRANAASKLEAYRSHTQKLALWCAFIAGITVSAIGVRTLGTFVDPASTRALASAGHAVQRFAFDFVDIWLTGGLLAGGSEGIHKLTQAYTDFMEATSKKAKSAA